MLVIDGSSPGAYDHAHFAHCSVRLSNVLAKIPLIQYFVDYQVCETNLENSVEITQFVNQRHYLMPKGPRKS